jgi:surface polysaccharide O-acyltransferase-like enzyme
MAKSFNYPIHAFRGFAILNIVAIHAFAFVLFYAENSGSQAGVGLMIVGVLNGVLLHDSTLYFTYISGILFSMVLAQRGYRRFFRSKFFYVFLPYLFFTVLYSTQVYEGPPGSPALFFDGTLGEFAQRVGMNLVTGNAILIFWYIPVLMALYLLTPLLARLIATPDTNWLKALIIFAPLIFSRVWPAVSWTNYVYFLGAYLIGMLVGTYYRETIQLIRDNQALLWITAIATSLGIAAVGFLEVAPYGRTNLAESAWYLQKIALAGLVLLWFDKTMTKVPGWLDVLGNYAFAVFFIHMFLLLQLIGWMAQNQLAIDNTLELLAYLGGAFALALGGSVFLTYLGKLLLGRYSRYFIGA